MIRRRRPTVLAATADGNVVSILVRLADGTTCCTWADALDACVNRRMRRRIGRELDQDLHAWWLHDGDTLDLGAADGRFILTAVAAP